MNDKLTALVYALAAFAVVWWLTRHNVAAIASAIRSASGTSVRVILHNLERVATSKECRLEIRLSDSAVQVGSPEPVRVYAGPRPRAGFKTEFVFDSQQGTNVVSGICIKEFIIPPRETVMVEWEVTLSTDAFDVVLWSGSSEILSLRVGAVDLILNSGSRNAISRSGMEARPKWSVFCVSFLLAAAGMTLLLMQSSSVECDPKVFNVVCADGNNVLRDLLGSPPWWGLLVPLIALMTAMLAFGGIRRSGSKVAQGYLWDELTLDAYSKPHPSKSPIKTP